MQDEVLMMLTWIHEGGGGTSARMPLAREAVAEAS